jgi:hypothetical protein
MAYESLFEDRGWTDVYYPKTGLFVWKNPDYPGVLIDATDEDGTKYVILAGDPRHLAARLTEFDDAAAALNFCERIAALADWAHAPAWANAPAGLGGQLHQIALDVTRKRGRIGVIK